MDENQTQSQSEKIQELSILVSDRIRSIDPKWWYALVLAFVLCIPFYFMTRSALVALMVSNHKFPAYVYQDEVKIPLEVMDRKIFKLGNNIYAGFIKVKNSANYEWGADVQPYTAVFTTIGGTEVRRVVAKTFVLPASEKIIIFSRFEANKEPTILNVTLGPTQFLRKPTRTAPNLSVERVNLVDVSESQLVVTAAIKNITPFTIKRIDLSVLLYDTNNNVVGANYTNVDDVLYNETRSFQFSWPNRPNAVRAEILPEVNIFDQNIYSLPAGNSQFDTSTIP